MRKFLSVFCLGWGTLTGQTLEEAKEEFRAQKLVLEEAAGDYFQAKVEAFSKKVPEGEGRLIWISWKRLTWRGWRGRNYKPEPRWRRNPS